MNKLYTSMNKLYTSMNNDYKNEKYNLLWKDIIIKKYTYIKNYAVMKMQ